LNGRRNLAETLSIPHLSIVRPSTKKDVKTPRGKLKEIKLTRERRGNPVKSSCVKERKRAALAD